MSVLKEVEVLIKEAIENIEFNTLDLIALDIKDIWEKLGEITGETANEQIIDAIFSKFCLGK